MAPFVRVRRKTHRKLPERITGPSKVKVGFPAGEVDGEVLNRAIWTHFGTAGGASGGGWGGPIPERPFLTNAIRDNRGAYKRAMHVSALKILLGETSLQTVLRTLGNKAQDDIKAEIVSLSTPPNSPLTIELKGSQNPLIDSGLMKDSVRWKIDE